MLLFGHHVVEAALRARRRKLNRLWSVTPAEHWQALASTAGVPVQLVSKTELDTRCQGGRHQGVALDCAPLPCCDASELLKARPQARPQDSSISDTGDTDVTDATSKCQARSAVLVVLDQVMDPHNLGSIARAAVALGAMGLVLPSQRTAPLSVVASRASAGGLEVLPLARVVNLARFLQQARQQGWWNVAATVEGGQAPAAIYPPGAEPTAWLLVLGGEEKGIRPLVQAQCDYLCTIANPGQICLNVAQAATILIEHFCR